MQISAQKEPRAAYEIYIMRHGIASKRTGDGGALEDAKRNLTAEGKEKMRKIGRGLQSLCVSLDWIVTSPLVRAVETAEIVAQSFDPAVRLDLCDGLRPGEPAEKILSLLAKQPGRVRVLLVGHEPDLGNLAARLIGAGPHANLVLKKGGCCLITSGHLSPGMQGQLVWWLTPRMLRAMA